MTAKTAERAALLRDKILETWNPPEEIDDESKADVAQTAAMQTIAFLMGRDFLPQLSGVQALAVDQGMRLMESVLEPQDTEQSDKTGDWIDAFETWLDAEIDAADDRYRANPGGELATAPLLLKWIRGKFQQYKRQGGSVDEVEKLRNAIRRHRDYRGDDRCLQDDAELYAILPEGDTRPPKDSAVTIENCQRYIQCRQQGREYVSPQRRIEELEAEIERLTTGMTCNGCGASYSIHISNQACDMSHREHWPHEWVSPLVKKLRDELVKASQQEPSHGD